MTLRERFNPRRKWLRIILFLHAVQWSVVLTALPQLMPSASEFGTPMEWGVLWSVYASTHFLSLAEVIRPVKARFLINVCGVLLTSFWAFSLVSATSWPSGAMTSVVAAVIVAIKTTDDLNA